MSEGVNHIPKRSEFESRLRDIEAKLNSGLQYQENDMILWIREARAIRALIYGRERLESRTANWTYDEGARAYYFAPSERSQAPYLKQVHVEAIIDVADDGTLAGIEIIDERAPPPPLNRKEPG